MDYKFAITAAIIGIIINIALSQVGPVILAKQPDESLLGEARGMFEHHGQTLVSSSAIVGTAVFLSVVATQYLNGVVY